jgi:ADP-heptose:LPS heptosyltransferase
MVGWHTASRVELIMPRSAHPLDSQIGSVRLALLIGEPLFWLFGYRKKSLPPFRLPEMRRLLVVRLDEIGDMVLFSPFLRELRRNLPKAWITLAVKPSLQNMVELCPYVDEVVTFDSNDTGRWPRFIRHWRALRLAQKDFWHRRFEAAMSPRLGEDTQHAIFLMYFSGARWRMAFSERVTANAPRLGWYLDKLLTHSFETTIHQHEVESNLEFLRLTGTKVEDNTIEMWCSSEDHTFAERLFSAHGITDNQLVVGLGPWAGMPQKQWPLSHFLELAAWLIEEHNAKLLLVGGEADRGKGEVFTRRFGDSVIDLTARATIRQTAASLRWCRIYVGNCSGPMHLAAAMKVPVVEVCCHPQTGSKYHVRSPNRFGPWGVRSIVLQPEQGLPGCVECCAFDETHCITQVSVSTVQAAVATLLSAPTTEGSVS